MLIFIKLTAIETDQPIYLAAGEIVNLWPFYDSEGKLEGSLIETKSTPHGGGYKVKGSPEEILMLIEETTRQRWRVERETQILWDRNSNI